MVSKHPASFQEFNSENPAPIRTFNRIKVILDKNF